YGTKGVMTSGSHCQDTRLLPASFHEATPKPKPTIPRSRHGHGGDFFAACPDTSAPAPPSNFYYSPRPAEIVFLGNIACLAGEKLSYNMKTGRTNSDKANALLARQPRKGWTHGYSS